MPNTITEPERQALRAEAERRVRAGEDRASVAQALGINPSTLRDWAAAGGWRRKDLADDPAAAREAMAKVAAKRRIQLDSLEAHRSRARELIEKLHATRAGMSSHDARPSPPSATTSPQEFALAYAQALMEDGRIEEADKAARFCIRFAEAAAKVAKLAEPAWRRQQRDYEKWLEDYRPDGPEIDELIEQVHVMNQEIRITSNTERQLMDAGLCHACARPAPEVDFNADWETAAAAAASDAEAADAPEELAADHLDQAGALPDPAAASASDTEEAERGEEHASTSPTPPRHAEAAISENAEAAATLPPDLREDKELVESLLCRNLLPLDEEETAWLRAQRRRQVRDEQRTPVDAFTPEEEAAYAATAARCRAFGTAPPSREKWKADHPAAAAASEKTEAHIEPG